MILGPKLLLKLVKTQKLVENLSERELTNPEGAGFDLRLGEVYSISGDAFLGEVERKTPDIKLVAKYDAKKKSSITLKPGDFYLMKTIEDINCPENLTGHIYPRSTTFRSGIFIRTTQTAPGYSGGLTFAIKNEGPVPVKIEMGARVVHIQFTEVAGGGSKYRGQWQGGRVTTTKKEKQVQKMSAEIPTSAATLEPADLREIHNNFASTPEGQNLSQQVRYDSYRPAHVSKEEWVELLGADASNLEHMPLTGVITEFFLRMCDPDQFDEEDRTILLTAATTHDWGEGVNGHEDITYRRKTQADTDGEHQALIGLVDREYLEKDPDLTEEIKRIHTEVVQDPESRLGRAFNAIERMGYLRTAVRSWELSHQVDDPAIVNALRWMSVDVLALHTQKLLEYAWEFDATQSQLDVYEQSISDIFSTVEPSIFYNYEKGEERDRMRGLFKAGRDVWRWNYPPEDETRDNNSQESLLHAVDISTLLRAGFNYDEISTCFADSNGGWCRVHISETANSTNPDIPENIVVIIERMIGGDHAPVTEFYYNAFSGKPMRERRGLEVDDYEQRVLRDPLKPEKMVTGDELMDLLEPFVVWKKP